MKIKFKHNGVWVIGQGSDQCIVIPGVNDLPKFKKHLDHPDVKDKIAKGILEIVEAPKGESQAKSGLTGMKEKDALSIVKETLSEETLKAWQAEEKRPKVLHAIEAQIANIVPSKEEKKD